MSQSIRVNGVWTARLPEETVPAWVARIPSNSGAPDECDKQTEWISGGVSVKVCTRCGDLSEQACTDLHENTVAELKENFFPEDP